MTKRLLLFFVFFWHITSYANDECSNAIQLTPSANCTNISGTFNGMTLSGAAPTCAPNASQDVWYRFTATEQTMAVSVSRATTGWTMYFAMEIYEDSCAGNRFKCIASDMNSVSYYNTDFVVGRTYYVRVLNASATIHALGFNICLQALPKPANDACANAALLAPNSSCTNTFGTFSGALQDGAAPTCAPNASQDVWYRFTATEQTMAISVSRATTGWTMYFAMEIYEDSCTGNRFKCIASDMNSVGYYNTDFVVGRTYYVRVLNASATIHALGFNICLQALPKPANDACANAALLAPSSSCTNTFGTFSGALQDGAAPTCAPNASQDVWYRFTATEQTMAISVSRATTGWTMYFAMEIYEDGCSGNRFKCIASDMNSVGYYNTDFVVGRTYYVRVLNASATIHALGFNICLQALPKPANDACANAALLAPSSSCTNTFGTFSGALQDGAAPSCAPNASQDVWYRFTATEQTMAISVSRATTGWTMYFAIEIYEDGCTGNRFKCIASDMNSVGYYNTDFVVGRTYYVRVLNASATIHALGFNICLQALPKPANDACANASLLAPNSSCTNTFGTFSGALQDGAAPSCAPNASQDVWYRFTATEQTMAISVSRATTGWTMYFAIEIYEDGCSGNRFKCIASDMNSVGYYNTDFVVGRTYYVRVLNSSATIHALGFNICLQAFPKPANDICATAAELTPNSSCLNTIGTFSGALQDGAAPNCALGSSQDVWYKFTATGQTMSVNIARISTGWTMYFALEIYEESCSGNRLQCTPYNTDGISYSSSNFVVGRTYYVRVLNASATIHTLSFAICLIGPPPVACTPSVAINASATSICQGQSVVFTATPTNGGTAPSYQWKVNGNNVGTNSPSYTSTTLANGSSVTCVMTSNASCASPLTATSNAVVMNVSAPVVPAFTQVEPICSGGSFTLPATSNNGITGTWSPGINTTATTTYTFTPNTGQCASTATMTVMVTSINTATTVQGSTITAAATGAAYQWINCANNQPINGATNASYTASGNGSYAVIVTQNGCSATSNCVQINNLDVDTFEQNRLKIYPNPATHQLFIQLNEATEIVIVDMTGKTIQQESLKAGNNAVDVSSLASGMYFIKSVSGANAKFVKK